MKLVAPFETSVERTEVRRILLVQVNIDGVIGWGECVAGETPSYSPETGIPRGSCFAIFFGR